MSEISKFYRFKKNVGHFLFATRFYIISFIAVAFLFSLYTLITCDHETVVETSQNVSSNTCEDAHIIDPWQLSATDVEATVYNAVPKQCNKDYKHTASMFRLDLSDVESHKIIAMERTFMRKLGLVYGDVVKISGTGKYDGIYQIQDTMNKRFAGQQKIDILVNKNVTRGKWNNVEIYTLKDKTMTSQYTKIFKASMKK